MDAKGGAWASPCTAYAFERHTPSAVFCVPYSSSPAWKARGLRLGQLALRRMLSAPDRASGYPELRPASADQLGAALAGHSRLASTQPSRLREAVVQREGEEGGAAAIVDHQ